MAHSGDVASSWCSFIPHDSILAFAGKNNLGAEFRATLKNAIDEGDELLAKVEKSEPLNFAERGALLPGPSHVSSHEHIVSGEDPDDPDQLTCIIYDAAGQDAIPGKATSFANGEILDPMRYMAIHSTLTKIFQFFDVHFNYKLFKDTGCTVAVTMNYGQSYMNAHWTGRRVVLGSGKPLLWRDFEFADDIIAHELTHGIIARTSGLKNSGESGALQEHLADVFGILYKNTWYTGDELAGAGDYADAKDCSWVIGDRLWGRDDHLLAIGPIIGREDVVWKRKPDGRITSVPDPNDPRLKIDRTSPEAVTFAKLPRYVRSFEDPESTMPPQPTHYDEFQRNLAYDNGGVHSNSGIANYAFYTAAMAAGRSPLKGVGVVWFRAMTEPRLGANCTFPRFAAFTVAYAGRDFPSLVAPIERGWGTVGVEPDAVQGIAASLSN